MVQKTNLKLQIGEKLFDLNSMGKLQLGIFKSRPNRFIGIIEVEGKEKVCHIADTGRLKEILTKNRIILVSKNRPELKTDYKLIACKMEQMVLINTSIHSKIAYNAIEKGLFGFKPENIKKEVTIGNSRLDFLINNNRYVELKGSNLLVENTCKFPDAPTTRGKKHVDELIQLKKQGFHTTILIMSMRKCDKFTTHRERDPEFANSFDKAMELGVEFKGFKVKIDKTNNNVVYNGELQLEQS